MPTLATPSNTKQKSIRISINPTRKSTHASRPNIQPIENVLKSMRASLARGKTHKPSTHAQKEHSPPKPQHHTQTRKNESPGILGSNSSLFGSRPPRDSKVSYKQWKANLNANIAAKSAKYRGPQGSGKAFTAFMTKSFIGETKGKLEALEEAKHASTATKRNHKRFAEAEKNLAINLQIATQAANKLGINASAIEPIPLEKPFSLIKHTNGPLEHYTLLGSTRKEQTGLTKSITNYTMNRSNNVKNTVKAGVTKVKSAFAAMGNFFTSSLQSILMYGLVLLAVLASIMSGNIYAMGSVIGLAILYFFVYPTIKKQLFGLLRIGYSH